MRHVPVWLALLALAACGGGGGGSGSPAGGIDRGEGVIVFASDRDEPFGLKEIYAVDPDGGQPRKLTTGGGFEPSLSRDGRRLAFRTFRPSGEQVSSEIFTMRIDGSELTRLTDDPAIDFSPVFSPDGRRVAFVSTRGGPSHGEIAPDIYVVGIDGQGLVRLTTDEGADDFNPVFSPDGRTIVYVSDPNPDDEDVPVSLFRVDVDGRNRRPLGGGNWSDFHPTFTPDGSRIVFASTRAGDGDGDGDGNADVFAMDRDASTLVRLTRTPGDDIMPAVSPDGSRIAFASDRDGTFQIYVMNADGSEPRRLTSRGDAEHFEPRFSPDGRRIACVLEVETPNGLDTDVLIVNVDGSGERNLTANPASEDEFDWR